MFSVANLLTAANLMSGIFAVLFAVSGRLDLAVFAIFAGAIFDFLDGFAARLLKTSGELGKQLDSLADMVTFGVAPGVMMMVILSINTSVINDISATAIHLEFTRWITAFSHGEMNILPLFGLLIPFFSLFRLAKFNLDTRQTTSFLGLPTPANTLFFTSFSLALFFDTGVSNEIISYLFNPYLIIPLIILMGLLMVSEMPLFSLKVKNFKWKGNQIRFSFLLISLPLICIFKGWSIALIILLYLIMSFVENTFVKNKENDEI